MFLEIFYVYYSYSLLNFFSKLNIIGNKVLNTKKWNIKEKSFAKALLKTFKRLT